MNTPLGTEIDNLRGLLEKSVQFMAPEERAKWTEREKLEAQQAETIRQHCADSIREIADAISSPRISRLSLERAQKDLLKALSLAAVLDPEE